MTTPLKVVLDAGPAVHQSAGLSRYTTRLIEHLRPDPRLDLSLFYNSHSAHNIPVELAKTQSYHLPMGQLQWRLSALLSQLIRLPNLNRAILANQPLPKRSSSGGFAKNSLADHLQGKLPTPTPQIYHATEHLLPRLSCLSILTVHDLIFERIPEHHTRRNRLFLKVAMPTFVRAADAIIAVSQQTKRDLIELYRTPAEKVTVIYEGIDDHFQPVNPDALALIRERYDLNDPYLLMVGTLEPRKNHATALRALARLRGRGKAIRLVVAGGQGWLFEPIRALVSQLGLEEWVTFAGYVPDADLPGLYSGADAVLVPSLYEGFGFSVLEAMACGAPVIASNVSSLPEVAGDAALLLSNPEDDEELFALIQRVLNEPSLRQTLVERGKAQASAFTWPETAKQTAELYSTVACSPSF